MGARGSRWAAVLAVGLGIGVPADALAAPGNGAEPVLVAGLRAVGAGSTAPPDRMPPQEPPRATAFAPDPFAAAQFGINWVQLEVCNWALAPDNLFPDCSDGGRQKNCVGCHVAGEAAFALARSVARCYSLLDVTCGDPSDENRLEFMTGFVADAQRKDCIIGPNTCTWPIEDPTTRDGFLQDLGSIGVFGPCGSMFEGDHYPVTQSAHGGLNLAGYSTWMSGRYSGNLLALSDWFVSRQGGSGMLANDLTQPPVCQGDAYVTGAAVIALAAARPFGSSGQRAAYDAAIARAAAGMRAVTLTTNQDKVFGLLTYLNAALPPDDPDYLALRADLLDDQQVDGGWSERPGLASNAYATGQALYALFEAGLAASDSVACAAIEWLREAQNTSGSWSMGTIGVSTDSIARSEFTATSWSVLALGSLERFGIDLSPAEPVRTTCDSIVTWTLTLGNDADNPCGLYPRNDLYLLDVTNDRGDTVSVLPPIVDLPIGGTASVTVTWEKTASGDGDTSVTTLSVSSGGAAGIGCAIVEERDLAVYVPAADNLYGVDLSPPDVLARTCDSLQAWELIVRNTAETPCGSAPTTDTFELTATNDLGDDVSITPPTVTLLPGEEAPATLTWTRVGGPRGSDTLSTTTARAVSTAARDAGLTVEATATRVVGTPIPTFRFALRTDPAQVTTESCDAAMAWPLQVFNAADDPCGDFPTTDTFELAASNDNGDLATVDPPTLTIVSGGDSFATVTWTRAAFPPPPGMPTTTTVVVTSVGARDAGEVVEAESAFAVVLPAQAPPWSIGLSPVAEQVTTCLPEISWDVVVSNEAGDSCGFYPVVDTIELAATVDTTDLVRVDPPTITLASGETGVVRLTWTRWPAEPVPGAVANVGLSATSTVARDAGWLYEVLATRRVDTPTEDPPFGVEVDPPSIAITSCESVVQVPVTLRNPILPACPGLSSSDSYDIVAMNDSGDDVIVAPASVTIAAGDSAVLDVTWTRASPPRDPGVTSRTTIVATSAESILAGAPLSDISVIDVVAPPDPLPAATMPSLRLSRSGADLVLSWSVPPAGIGSREVVALARAQRGDRTSEPEHGVLDGLAATASVAPAALGVTLPGLGATGGAELIFLKMRDTSACRLLPGPTCGFGCSDPRRCDGICP